MGERFEPGGFWDKAKPSPSPEAQPDAAEVAKRLVREYACNDCDRDDMRNGLAEAIRAHTRAVLSKLAEEYQAQANTGHDHDGKVCYACASASIWREAAELAKKAAGEEGV